jgi:hypothetical protein
MNFRLPGASRIAFNGQAENAEPSISSVVAGIVIEVSRDDAKASFPIFFSLEERANVIVCMLQQYRKHRSPIVSTEEGTVNSSNP